MKPLRKDAMKLITTANSLASETQRLIKHYPNISFGVAWASASPSSYKLLLKHREKIRVGVIGIHFYQTDADVLDDFIDSQQVKFVLQASGVFHPKVYLFWNDDFWEAIIGSANFTAGAFSKNTELCTLLTKDDGLDLAQLQSLIDQYSENAKTLSADEAKRYRHIRESKLPELHKLKDQYGQMPPSKPAIESEVMGLDWQSYLALIKQDDQHGFEERLLMLDWVQRAFASVAHFKDLDAQTRRAIAGLPNEVLETAAWFGSMQGAGRFKNRVIDQPQHLSDALDHIPLTGTVTRVQYKSFIKSFCKAFPDGGGGIGTSTRLLSMKRPDQFLCVDSANLRKLAEDVGITQVTTLDYDRYWDEVVERVMDAPWWKSKPPTSGPDLKAWRARAAMLDALFYEPKK
jgi:hypothetical protein